MNENHHNVMWLAEAPELGDRISRIRQITWKKVKASDPNQCEHNGKHGRMHVVFV